MSNKEPPLATKSRTISALPDIARPTLQVSPTMRPPRFLIALMRWSVRSIPALLSSAKSPTYIMLESICVCAFFLCSYLSTLSNPSGDSQLQVQRPQQQWLPKASATNHVQLLTFPSLSLRKREPMQLWRCSVRRRFSTPCSTNVQWGFSLCFWRWPTICCNAQHLDF